MSTHPKKQWLAVASRYHAAFFEWHDSEQSAKESLDLAESSGDCYAAAIYNVKTETIKMRDALHAYSQEKVLASIHKFLSEQNA